MDEQKTQTSAQPEHIPLLLIARELWRKLGLILMFAATVAACGYIAATLLYRPVYQTQTTFVVSVRNGSTVYANLNTASSMAETLSTFFEGDVPLAAPISQVHHQRYRRGQRHDQGQADPRDEPADDDGQRAHAARRAPHHAERLAQL